MSPNQIAQPLFDLWGFNYEKHHPDGGNLHDHYLSADILILHDSLGLVAAMYPAGYKPDIQYIQLYLKREKLSAVVSDGIHSILSPLKPDAILLVVDKTLLQDEKLFFQLPNDRYGLVLSEPDAQLGQYGNYVSASFAKPARNQRPSRLPLPPAPIKNLKKRISGVEELPALPETAYHLLKLRDNPEASIEQLVSIIQCDPALAAQIMRQANSAWYKSAYPAETMHDAIFRVIGFENTIYIALGSIIGKTYTLANSGPLGKKQQWQSAVYRATLSQTIAESLTSRMQIKSGLAYLTTLLLNIGVMVMAQLFRTEYLWLNNTLAQYPELEQSQVEKKYLGITHQELGSLLLLEWNLPLAITTVVLEEPNSHYQGPFENYVNISQLASTLYRQHTSPQKQPDIPDDLLSKLGITSDQARQLLNQLDDNDMHQTALDMAS